MTETTTASKVVPRHPTALHALYHSAKQRHSHAISVVDADLLSIDMPGLAATACRYAAALAERGVRAGDRVLVGMPTRLESVIAFFGIQLLGAIPAPVAVLNGAGRSSTRQVLAGLSHYLRPAAVVLPNTVAAELAADGTSSTAPVLDGDALYRETQESGATELRFRLPQPTETAFIQCTSGSTGSPKGVIVSHANVAANCEQIVEFARWSTDDVWAGWLPLYHDMGLIGGLLTPLFAGSSAVLLPPARFLRSPVEWIRVIHRFRGTITATPNFGLAYVDRRISDDELKDLDVSCLRMVFCGAEPVSRPTIETFGSRLARCGLPEGAVVPCYGLAEASLIVSAAAPSRTVLCDTVSRRVLSCEGRAVDASPGHPDAQEVVALGTAVRGTEIRIVNQSEEPVADNVLGRVQFRGPSRTDGYYGSPGGSADNPRPGGWWDTGDVGYIRNGGLRITGRERDIIVIRGANYFPSDIEQAAHEVHGVAAGAVVATGHRDPLAGTELLCLIVETATGESDAELDRAIRSAVGLKTGVAVSRIYFVARHSIPKTTSGKVQRRLAYQQLIANIASETRDGQS